MDPNRTRLKQLDLLGGLGAGILGAGLALIFARWLQPFAIPALLVGILSHGWAMFAKSTLERQARMAQPRWAIGAEWVCWMMLIALTGYVAYKLVR